MDKKQKQVIMMVAAIIMIIIIFMIAMSNTKKNNTNKQQEENLNVVNTENKEENKQEEKDKYKQEKEVLGYKIKMVEIKTEQNQTKFTIEVTNITEDTSKGTLLNLILIDKNNVDITSAPVYVRSIESSQTIETTAIIEENVSNIYDYRVELGNNASV